MNCFYHSDQPAVAQCSVCKKGLCCTCVATKNTILCIDCLGKRRNQLQKEINAYKESEKKQKRKMQILTVVFCVLGVFLGIYCWVDVGWDMPSNLYPVAFLFTVYLVAGIPYGWSFLNKYLPTAQGGAGGRTIWILDADTYYAVGFMEILFCFLKYTIKLMLAMCLGWFFLTRELIQYFKKK